MVKLQVYAEQSRTLLHEWRSSAFAERQIEYYRTRVSDVEGAVGLIPFSELNKLEFTVCLWFGSASGFSAQYLACK